MPVRSKKDVSTSFKLGHVQHSHKYSILMLTVIHMYCIQHFIKHFSELVRSEYMSSARSAVPSPVVVYRTPRRRCTQMVPMVHLSPAIRRRPVLCRCTCFLPGGPLSMHAVPQSQGGPISRQPLVLVHCVVRALSSRVLTCSFARTASVPTGDRACGAHYPVRV